MIILLTSLCNAIIPESLCIAYGDPGLFTHIHADSMPRLYDFLPVPSEKALVQLCLARACQTANLRAAHKVMR